MFELLGSETDHEAAVKRVMNLQEEMINNLYRITELEIEIKTLKKETNTIEEALDYWKLEVAKHYNCFQEQLIKKATHKKEKADN